MSNTEQIRLIALLDPDGASPIIAGAISETIWEIIPDEDWERIRRKMIEASEMDPRDSRGDLDLIVEVPYDELKRLGQPSMLGGKVGPAPRESIGPSG